MTPNTRLLRRAFQRYAGTTITVIPPDGQDFKSREAVLEAWESDALFLVSDQRAAWNGRPLCASDIAAHLPQVAWVNVRYNGAKDVAPIEVKRAVRMARVQTIRGRQYDLDDPVDLAALVIDGGMESGGFKELVDGIKQLEAGIKQAQSELAGLRRVGAGNTEAEALVQAHLTPKVKALQETCNYIMGHFTKFRSY